MQDARRLLGERAYDLVIIDIDLPDGSGLDLIPEINKRTHIIIFSGHEVEDKIMEHISACLTKSKTSNERLPTTIKRAINESGGINALEDSAEIGQ